MSAAGMLDLSGAHGAAAAANAITSNRFSYSMNLKVNGYKMSRTCPKRAKKGQKGPKRAKKCEI